MTHRHTWTTKRSFVLACAVFIFGQGCSVDSLSVARVQEDPTNAYWRAQLTHRAITLSTSSPGDTVQLSMVALTYNNDTIPSDGILPVYTSSDSNLVSVSPAGVVRAKGVTSGVQIRAWLTVGEITYSDTAIVKVVADPAPKTLGSLRFQVPENDSAKTDITTSSYLLSRFVKVLATDSTPMPEIIVDYRSLSLHTIPNRSTGALPARPYRKLGPVKFAISAYAYGKAYSDTLDFVVGLPLTGFNPFFRTRARLDSLGLETYVTATRIIGGVGAQVCFTNDTEQDVYLVFEDTANIQSFGSSDESINRILRSRHEPNFALRRACQLFTAAGIYKFRDQYTTANGAIHILAE